MPTEIKNVSRAILLSVIVCAASLIAGAAAWRVISLNSHASEEQAQLLRSDDDKYFVTTMVKEKVLTNENGRPVDCPNYLLKVKEEHFFLASDLNNIPYCKALAYKQHLEESLDVCSAFNYLKSEADYNEQSETTLSGYCNI